MELKKRGRNQAQKKLEQLEKYGSTWTVDDLKSSLDYYTSTFLAKYIVR